MRVKICGITNLEDALAAADCGADAIGFVFAPDSPRFVPADQVRKMISKLPPFIATVGVFSGGEEKEIRDAVDECGIDLVQFHGPFSSRIVHAFSNRAIQVVRVESERSLEGMASYSVRAFLLDTFHPKMPGGSGVSFDWEIASRAGRFGKIILAGGLTPENVGEAIMKARPYGVDVSSGVEMRKGKKDPVKLKRFIEAAKGGGMDASSR